MKKVYALILVLVFVLTACAADAEPDAVLDVVARAPAAAPEPKSEPEPDEPAHGLLNYEEWYGLHPEDTPPFEVELDWLVISNILDDGYTMTAVMFPRQWPSKQLEDGIPEYIGMGYMQELFITHPNMSLRTEDIESMKLSVYKYKDEDIKNYIENLSGFTPDEELAEEYYLDRFEWSPYIRSVQSFRKDGVILNIVFAEDDYEEFELLSSGKFLQFDVTYTREAYMFDPDVTEPTELLNFFEFAEIMEYDVPAEMSLDYLIDTFEDAGMYYSRISAPSKWPRDGFGDLIPAYTGFGFLQAYEITTPQDDTSPENALLVSAYITTDDTVEIEAYARRVAGFGYYELPPEEYDDHEKSLADEREMVRVFCLPGHRCVISTYINANLPTLDIALYFEGRRQNFFAGQNSPDEQEAAQGSTPAA